MNFSIHFLLFTFSRYLRRMPDRMFDKAQHAQILVVLLDVRPNLRIPDFRRVSFYSSDSGDNGVVI